MRPRSLLAPLLVALAVPAALHAQADSPIIGKWSIEYESGRRMENGAVTPVMGKGTITITPKGDSLVAVMEGGTRQDGTPAAPSNFTGKLTADGALFIQKREGQVNMNGEVKPITIIMTWVLKANGDVLTGSLKRELPAEMSAMMASGDATPVKGTRVKG